MNKAALWSALAFAGGAITMFVLSRMELFAVSTRGLVSSPRYAVCLNFVTTSCLALHDGVKAVSPRGHSITIIMISSVLSATRRLLWLVVMPLFALIRSAAWPLSPVSLHESCNLPAFAFV